MSAVTMMPNNAPGSPSGNRPIQPSQDKVTIKRVGIGSAFKMGCGLSMLLVAVFGAISLVIWIIIVLITPSVLSSFSASVGGSLPNGLLGTALPPGLSATANAIATPSSSGAASSGGGTAIALGIGAGCVSYIVGILLYGLFGGIGAAIYAIFYNVAGRWFGGIEVELKR